MLQKVRRHSNHHAHLEQIDLGIAAQGRSLLVVDLLLAVLDKHDAGRHPRDPRPIGGGGVVNQVRVHCLANEPRHLRAHAVLHGQRDRRHVQAPPLPRQHQPLEEAHVDVEAVARLLAQAEVLRLWGQLPVVAYHDELPALVAQRRQHLRLEDLARLLNQDHRRAHLPKHASQPSGGHGGAPEDGVLRQHAGLAAEPQVLQRPLHAAHRLEHRGQPVLQGPPPLVVPVLPELLALRRGEAPQARRGAAGKGLALEDAAVLAAAPPRPQVPRLHGPIPLGHDLEAAAPRRRRQEELLVGVGVLVLEVLRHRLPPRLGLSPRGPVQPVHELLGLPLQLPLPLLQPREGPVLVPVELGLGQFPQAARPEARADLVRAAEAHKRAGGHAGVEQGLEEAVERVVGVAQAQDLERPAMAGRRRPLRLQHGLDHLHAHVRLAGARRALHQHHPRVHRQLQRGALRRVVPHRRPQRRAEVLDPPAGVREPVRRLRAAEADEDLAERDAVHLLKGCEHRLVGEEGGRRVEEVRGERGAALPVLQALHRRQHDRHGRAEEGHSDAELARPARGGCVAAGEDPSAGDDDADGDGLAACGGAVGLGGRRGAVEEEDKRALAQDAAAGAVFEEVGRRVCLHGADAAGQARGHSDADDEMRLGLEVDPDEGR